jgi:hypothetical protein
MIAVAAAIGLPSANVTAGPVFFDTEGAWNEAVRHASVATFEGLVPVGERELNLQTKRWRDGAFEFSATYPDLMEIIAATPGVPFENPYTSDIIHFQGWIPNPTLDVVLESPSSAIGFAYWMPGWGRDPLEPAGASDLKAVLLGLNHTYEFSLTSPLERMGFFGVTVDDSIYQVQLIAARGTGMGIDNFTAADVTAPPIPEPATMLLLGTGVAALVSRRKPLRA